MCDECDERLTVSHIILDCGEYLDHRIELINYLAGLGKRFNLFNILQDDPVIIELVLKFLRDANLYKFI